MAYEISAYAVKITLVAGSDLSASQFKFVKLNSNGQAVAITAATDTPIGVLQNTPLNGQEAQVVVSGGSKLLLGGAVPAAGRVSPNASGAAVAVTAGTDGTKYLAGQALTGGASGEIITAVVSLAAAGRAA